VGVGGGGVRRYSADRLVAIECDACDALIAPNPSIAESGWVKCGRVESGVNLEWDYCPKHSHIAERMAGVAK
jgi:hypothetical protein